MPFVVAAVTFVGGGLFSPMHEMIAAALPSAFLGVIIFAPYLAINTAVVAALIFTFKGRRATRMVLALDALAALSVFGRLLTNGWGSGALPVAVSWILASAWLIWKVPTWEPYDYRREDAT